MLWITHVPPETIYIILSAMIAIIIWFEGQALKTTDGKLPNSSWFHIGSLIDTLWFFVSVAVLYFFEFESTAMSVPVAYGLYSLFGWVYGTKLMSQDGLPDSPESLVVPKSYIAYSQSFSLIFFMLCMLVLALPWLPIQLPKLL